MINISQNTLLKSKYIFKIYIHRLGSPFSRDNISNYIHYYDYYDIKPKETQNLHFTVYFIFLNLQKSKSMCWIKY